MTSDFGFYFELFKKRIPAMSVIFALSALAAIAIAMTLPPRYSADASLAIERAQIPVENSEGDTKAAERLELTKKQLLRRATLIDIAQKFQVYAGEEGLDPDEIVERMREQADIKVSSGRNRPSLMTISFSALSPRVAADVVNEFVTIVLVEDAERRKIKAGKTLEFYEQEVERYNALLVQRSAEIVAFKEANQDALPESYEYHLDQQSTLQEGLNLGARQLVSLKDQKNRLKAIGTASSQDVSAISQEQQQLAAARANLSGLRATLSDTHPKVKNLRARIKLLESRVEGTLDVDTNSPTTTTSKLLQLQLAEIDSEIRFLEDEKARSEAELTVLRSAIERTPKVAIRLEELAREYENTQSLYDQAVSERAKAQTGEIIVFSSQDEKIIVLEQAAVPNAPTSPNRKLIAGGGVFAGAALAGLFFALTELMNRTIRRPIDLTRGLGVQPLATIPYIELPGDRKKRQLTTGLVIVLIIAAIVAALWTVHTQYAPLDLLFDRFVEQIGL